MNGWTWPAAVAVTMPLLVSAAHGRAETPPSEPLEAYVFDTSAWPTVLVDVVIPWEFATAQIEPAQLELDGGRIESVAPVDPVDSVVSLVIDDSPKVPAEVVYNAQGASVELVRNVREGTAIAVSTPSGMQTRPTSDQGASMSRINGISAGAPDVLPLNRLVLDAARVLVGTAWSDRHLVLAVGRPISEGPTLRALAGIVKRANIRLHVVADPGVETGAIASLAEETGGVAGQGETMLADMDAVTAEIVHRVRVAATVDGPGPLPLALTLGGVRYTAEVDVPAAPPARPSSTETSPNDSVPGTPAPTVAPETATPATAAASGSATGHVDANRRGPLLIAAFFVAAGVVAVAWLLSRARRRAATPPAVTPQPTPPAEPDPVVAPTPAPSATRQRTEPEPANSPAGDTLPADWRRPSDRPHRATPRRRPAPSATPQPEEDPPQEEPASEGEWLVVGRIRLNRRTGHVWAGTRRISLTPSEFAVLQLLMMRGGHGVTRDAILAASTTGNEGDDAPDPDVVLAELRRKTGIRGRGQGVRQERALVYFFGQ